jgi:hypothetical protein
MPCFAISVLDSVCSFAKARSRMPPGSKLGLFLSLRQYRRAARSSYSSRQNQVPPAPVNDKRIAITKSNCSQWKSGRMGGQNGSGKSSAAIVRAASVPYTLLAQRATDGARSGHRSMFDEVRRRESRCVNQTMNILSKYNERERFILSARYWSSFSKKAAGILNVRSW